MSLFNVVCLLFLYFKSFMTNNFIIIYFYNTIKV